MNKNPKIADYDEAGYDYTTYWSGRAYSDKSEEIALRKMYGALSENEKNGWFVDIGGSFGRLDRVHSEFFEHRIIFDYSKNSLEVAKRNISDPKLQYIAGNVYFMPFAENSIRFATSIRVAHHLEELDSFFKEVYRILEPGGIFFFEVANKMHLKARAKNLLSRNKEFFTEEPYQQPISKEGLFLNFHPNFVLLKLKDAGFEGTKKILSVSNFRSKLTQKKPLLKPFLLLEKFLQKPFAALSIGPSMFYIGRKPGKIEKGTGMRDIPEILADPYTKKPTTKEEIDFENGIYDFRVK